MIAVGNIVTIGKASRVWTVTAVHDDGKARVEHHLVKAPEFTEERHYPGIDRVLVRYPKVTQLTLS